MDIKPNEIAYKKTIGKSGIHKVFEIGTIGGLNLIIKAAATPQILGIGSHKAISRHIAQKKDPDLVITELSKSHEDFDAEHFKGLIEKYEIQTDALRKLQGL